MDGIGTQPHVIQLRRRTAFLAVNTFKAVAIPKEGASGAWGRQEVGLGALVDSRNRVSGKCGAAAVHGPVCHDTYHNTYLDYQDFASPQAHAAGVWGCQTAVGAARCPGQACKACPASG